MNIHEINVVCFSVHLVYYKLDSMVYHRLGGGQLSWLLHQERSYHSIQSPPIVLVLEVCN